MFHIKQAEAENNVISVTYSRVLKLKKNTTIPDVYLAFYKLFRYHYSCFQKYQKKYFEHYHDGYTEEGEEKYRVQVDDKLDENDDEAIRAEMEDVLLINEEDCALVNSSADTPLEFKVPFILLATGKNDENLTLDRKSVV